MESSFVTREITAADRGWVAHIARREWGATTIVSRGRVHDAETLPGYVVVDGDERIGMALVRAETNQLEVVALVATRRGVGVGSALLDAVVAAARSSGCARVWLVTTNDNEIAQRFYEREGWQQVGVHTGAVDEARRIKPEIPVVAPDGERIRDEIEFELGLN